VIDNARPQDAPVDGESTDPALDAAPATTDRRPPTSRPAALALRIAHLYPRLMNVYGDRGNIICLRHRCEARGIAFDLTELGPGDRFDPRAFDLVFAGGAQDREQRGVADDLLATKAEALREAVEGGVALLAVCGAYQLFGRYYRDATGAELPGAGVFDLHTEHPGEGARRCIGNIVAEWTPVDGIARMIAGFENHGGRTWLGPGAQPLACVRRGHGNNGEDGYEGAVYKNAIGTYIHGSLLPKNPALADHVLLTALGRRYHGIELPPIDDRAELRAHAAALRLR
jgi:lipid II isoglutaminyl synthase (glutamine-hydrolysing)